MCAKCVIRAHTWSLHGDRPFPLSSSVRVKYGSTVFWCCDSELKSEEGTVAHMRNVLYACSVSLTLSLFYRLIILWIQHCSLGRAATIAVRDMHAHFKVHSQLVASTECVQTPLAQCMHRLTHTCTDSHLHACMHMQQILKHSRLASQHNCSCGCCLPCAAAH